MTPASADRLELLYRLSQTFSSSLDLDEVLNRVMDEVIAAVHAERGFLMLLEPDGTLAFRVAHGLNQQGLEAPEFQVSRGVVERVAAEGRPTLTSDAQTDAWLGDRSSIRLLGLRSVLCVPLRHKEVSLGVIYVDNRLRAGIFTQHDLELLTAIAGSAAVAVENARLYQVAVEKGRLERELQLAREVQVSLLPRDTPVLPGWEFAARWLPAREVAGDFYDFLSLPEGRLGIVIGDVSDKGIPAALFMGLTRSIVRASLAAADSPAQGLTEVNRLLCAESTSGMFVTLFFVQLDPAVGEMVYVNAGHNPPYLLRAESGEVVRLTRTGMALGLMEGHELDQGRVRLDPGDALLLFTDGVTEALNDPGEMFSDSRLQEFLLAHRSDRAADLAEGLEVALSSFMGGAAPHDDITLVAIKRA